MKLHRTLAEAVVQSLHSIFQENKYADKVIERTLKQNPKWGSRDRKFIAETTYDIVRWKRLYQAISNSGDFDYWSWLSVWLARNEFEVPAWKEFNDLPIDQLKKEIG